MSFPSKPTSISSLPPELLSNILGCFEQASWSSGHPFVFANESAKPSRRDLCSAALVCRDWRVPAQSILQKHITLSLDDTSTSVHRFWHSLSDSGLLLRQDLQQAIQSLSLTVPTAESGFDKPLPDYLGACTHLSRLHLIVLEDWFGGDLRPVEQYLPRLKTLAIQCWGGSRFPPDMLDILSACPRLEALFFTCQDTEDSTPLQTLSLPLPYLRTVELHGSPWFIYSMLENLAPLTKLVNLSITYTAGDDTNLPWPSHCQMPLLQRFAIRVEGRCSMIPDLALLQTCRHLKTLAIDTANIPAADIPHQLSLIPPTVEEVTWLRLDETIMVIEAMLYSTTLWLPNLVCMRFAKHAFMGMRAAGALRMCSESLNNIDSLLDERKIVADMKECKCELDMRLNSI